MKKLTSRFVQSITKPGKYYDGNNVFLRVHTSGSKKWVQRCTINGKRREIGLGSANIVSLASMREKALENLRMITDGVDPIAIKAPNPAYPTFKEASHTVYEQNLPTWKNKKHAAQFISTLKTYVFPHFGHIKVNEITSSNLLSALQPIWLSKPETARRVRQRIGVVLKWCIANEWRRDNPADNISEGLPKQPKKKDHRKSISYTEVGNFITSLKGYSSGLIPKLALEYLILTATRPIETRLASWNEINKDLWIIPAERMKAGITHRIPLSSRCLEILNEAKKLSDGSDYIFYGYKPNIPLSENIFMNLINNLNIEVHSHGFRTSFRTWTQEKTNYPNEVAEAALAHKLQDKAEAAYARSDLLEKRKEMMQAWCDYILNPEAKVISIRR